MTNPLNVEVISDFACPWCYIGKRRLDDAIARHTGEEVKISWRPFQLNPDMPREGRNRNQYYARKFGQSDLERLKANIRQAGMAEGIVFEYPDQAIAPNTLSAHTLMDWAQEAQKAGSEEIDSHDLAEKLFYAHHVAHENIGDHRVLARIAGEAGMDSEAVLEKLAAAVDEDKTGEKVREAYELGVTGVPFFVFEGRYGVSGAQSADTLAAAFAQIRAQQGGTNERGIDQTND